LELAVGFQNSRHTGFPLAPDTPLIVTGSISGDLALMESLRGRVEYTFEPLSPPVEYPEHLPVAQYAVNIGLALKGVAGPSDQETGEYTLPDINLLPQTYLPWKPSIRQLQSFAAILVAVALLFPLYQVTSAAIGETAMLESRYNIINGELERRQVIINSRQPLQTAIDQYNAIIDMGGGLTEDLNTINSYAEELGVSVSSISHNGGSITVNCEANSYIIFREYLDVLRGSGRFSSVQRPSEQYSYVKGGIITLRPK